MDKLNFLDDLSKKLSEALPEDLKTLKKDLENNFHTVLQAAFTRLDLITREEFDAQTKVLARTRKKIESLETKVKELEKLVEGKNADK